jgi:hypothetical protein
MNIRETLEAIPKNGWQVAPVTNANDCLLGTKGCWTRHA